MKSGFKAFLEEIPSQVIQQQRQQAEQRRHSARILQQLRASEKVLNVLRPISPKPRTLDHVTIEKFMKAVADVKPTDFQDDTPDTSVVDPQKYFLARYPEQTKRWGPAFFGDRVFLSGRDVFIPDSVNDLTFAAILAGDSRLGHQVVYYPAEVQWYFKDFRFDGAFLPTSEEKLGILVTHYFIECSQDCHPLSAKAVLKLRTPQTIKTVITTAKAMLDADSQFFHGTNGHRRYVAGRNIEPMEEPSYQLFVKCAIVRQPEGKVTVQDAFHRYFKFCRNNAIQPLTRAEFKDLVAEVIREEFDLGIRHDVLDERGKQTHGWLGIDCRLEEAPCFGRN